MDRRLLSDVFFVGTPAGDERFDLSRLPTWSFAGDGGWYGFPSVDGRGLKACPTDERPPFDPDLGERVVGADAAARARDYVGRRFPALRGQPILETRVCQVTNTANGYDFLVDRHPQLENVWLVGGGSGHGFKHGPALGEHIALSVLGEPVDAELKARFRLQPTASLAGDDAAAAGPERRDRTGASPSASGLRS